MDRESAPNNLFYCSEILIAHALLKTLSRDNYEVAFDNLVDELFKVALWFVRVSDGLMEAIIMKNEKELRTIDPEEVHFDKIEPFQSIIIPWFTNTTEAVRNLHPSA
ncbi:MAG: hypothetical protein ROW52_11995 [Anaerolineaceae bacterium]|jgi:hypothetical protein